MATKHSLNYKTLISPEENIESIRSFRKRDANKNYNYIIGYEDTGAYLTPLSIDQIQENAKKVRKNVLDLIFSPCDIRDGMKYTTYVHINYGLKTYLAIDKDYDYEIIVA